MYFDNVYQTGNPLSGGWRFPYGGATSTDAFNYKPMGIDPEFLRQVAGMGRPEDKPRGLLDEIVTPQPLEGLLSGDTGFSPGDAPSTDSKGSPSATAAPAAEPGSIVETSPAGTAYSVDPTSAARAAAAMMMGSPMAAIAALVGGAKKSEQASVWTATPKPVTQPNELEDALAAIQAAGYFGDPSLGLSAGDSAVAQDAASTIGTGAIADAMFGGGQFGIGFGIGGYGMDGFGGDQGAPTNDGGGFWS